MKKFLTLSVVACAIVANAEVLFPDPSIFYDNGTYYLIGTENSPQVKLSKSPEKEVYPLMISKNCVDWQRLDKNGKRLSCIKMKDSKGTAHFWAPQIFKYQNKYYLAYCSNLVSGKDEDLNKMRCMIASTDKIEDGFKNAVVLDTDAGEIDPFIFIDDDGTPYAFLVRWQHRGGVWVQKLSKDLKTRIGAPKNCIINTEAWEKKPLTQEFLDVNEARKKENPKISHWELFNTSDGVAEGPTVMKRGGKYVLFYSANDFRSPFYCVGYAVANSPTGEWKKASAPVLSRENTGLNGIGHGDIFFDEKGDIWYVFHAHHSNIRVSPRRTGVIKLIESFDKDGNPSYKADYSTMRLL